MTPAELPRAPLACGDLSALLRAGRPAAFPTDTLPALAMAPAWAAELWQIKQRAANKPLILMAAGRDELLAALGMPPPQGWEQLTNQGWPGGSPWCCQLRGLWCRPSIPVEAALGFAYRRAQWRCSCCVALAPLPPPALIARGSRPAQAQRRLLKTFQALLYWHHCRGRAVQERQARLWVGSREKMAVVGKYCARAICASILQK